MLLLPPQILLLPLVCNRLVTLPTGPIVTLPKGLIVLTLLPSTRSSFPTTYLDTIVDFIRELKLRLSIDVLIEPEYNYPKITEIIKNAYLSRFFYILEDTHRTHRFEFILVDNKLMEITHIPNCDDL